MTALVHISSTDHFKQEVIDYKGVALVDFYADWCGPCRMLAPMLEELAEENAGKDVKIIKINVDTNPDLATEYGITGIPAIFLFKAGQAKTSLVGVQPKEMYQEKIDAYLTDGILTA